MNKSRFWVFIWKVELKTKLWEKPNWFTQTFTYIFNDACDEHLHGTQLHKPKLAVKMHPKKFSVSFLPLFQVFWWSTKLKIAQLDQNG